MNKQLAVRHFFPFILFVSLLLIISLATIGLVPATTLATQAGAEELRGKVIKVDGRLVRIVMESKMWARVGDTVRLGKTMSGFDELIFMAGEWTVTEVTSKYVQAEAGAGASGTPGRDYVAVIRSANPQPRPVAGTGVTSDKRKEIVSKKPPVDAAAIYKEALKYHNGDGVQKDEKRAFRLFKEAGEMGHGSAQRYVGWMYQKGQGVAVDYQRAVRFYEKACDGGNISGCGNLGYMYENGKGVTKDYGRAVELYEKACKTGHQWSCDKLKEFGK